MAAIFSSRLKNDNPPMIYEDGKQSRDFVNVRDLVEAKWFLLNNPKAQFDSYNICTGRATSVKEVAEILARRMGKDIAPQIVERFRSGDIRHCFGDPSKLAALGWKARIPLEDGFDELVAWAEEQEAIDRTEQAHRELVERGMVKE